MHFPLFCVRFVTWILQTAGKIVLANVYLAYKRNSCVKINRILILAWGQGTDGLTWRPNTCSSHNFSFGDSVILGCDAMSLVYISKHFKRSQQLHDWLPPTNTILNLKVACTATIAFLAARRSASQELLLYRYLLHLILFYDTREICNIGKWIHKCVQDIPCYWTIKWGWNIKEQIRSALKMEVLVCLII